MHRLAPGSSSALPRRVGSSVWQVFDGKGVIELAGQEPRGVERRRHRGAVVVPDACLVDRAASTLFMFSDAPVYEALDLVEPQ